MKFLGWLFAVVILVLGGVFLVKSGLWDQFISWFNGLLS